MKIIKENYKDTYHFVAERFDRDETTGGTVEAVSEKQAYYLARKMFPRCKIYDMTLISKGNTDRHLEPKFDAGYRGKYIFKEDEETGLTYVILNGKVIATFPDIESAEDVYGELPHEK